MRIIELFESNPQVPGVVPGDKIGETPPGARPTGDFPTPITQGPPKTSNTPKTVSPTGFTPGAKPQPGSSATTNPPTDPNEPVAPQQAAAAAGAGASEGASSSSKPVDDDVVDAEVKEVKKG